MENRIEDRVKNVMSAVFGVPVDEFNDDASPHTVKGWDSLKHINLIVALEEDFNIQFDDEEISSLINYSIIVSTIKAY